MTNTRRADTANNEHLGFPRGRRSIGVRFFQSPHTQSPWYVQGSKYLFNTSKNTSCRNKQNNKSTAKERSGYSYNTLGNQIAFRHRNDMV